MSKNEREYAMNYTYLMPEKKAEADIQRVVSNYKSVAKRYAVDKEKRTRSLISYKINKELVSSIHKMVDDMIYEVSSAGKSDR